MKYGLFALLVWCAQAAVAQTPQTVDVAALKDKMEAPGSGIQVVNFWATWCAPCVAELHFFDEYQAAHPDVHVTLVSLDLDLNPDPQKVYKYVAQKKIHSEVLLLKERDPNSWIEKIEPDWSGAIPATLIINNRTGERRFIEHELHEGELEQLISQVSS